MQNVSHVGELVAEKQEERPRAAEIADGDCPDGRRQKNCLPWYSS